MKRTVLSMAVAAMVLTLATSAFAQGRRQGPPPERGRGEMRGMQGLGPMLRELPDEQRRAVMEKLRKATPEQRHQFMEKFRNATPEQRTAWLSKMGGESDKKVKKQKKVTKQKESKSGRRAPGADQDRTARSRNGPARRPAQQNWLEKVPQEEWERMLDRLKKVRPEQRAAVVERFGGRHQQAPQGREQMQRQGRGHGRGHDGRMQRGGRGTGRQGHPMMQRGGRGMGRQGHPMMQRGGRGMGRQGHPMMQRGGRGMGRQGHPMMQRGGRGMGRQGHPMMQRGGHGMGRQGHPMMQRGGRGMGRQGPMNMQQRGGGCPHCEGEGAVQQKRGGKKAPRRPRPPMLPVSTDAGWFVQ